MITESVKKEELSEAILAVNKLKTSKLINDNIADILFRCLSVVSDLQNFGDSNGHAACDTITHSEKKVIKVPTIKMVPKEGAHVLPQNGTLVDDYLSRSAKPVL